MHRFSRATINVFFLLLFITNSNKFHSQNSVSNEQNVHKILNWILTKLYQTNCSHSKYILFSSIFFFKCTYLTKLRKNSFEQIIKAPRIFAIDQYTYFFPIEIPALSSRTKEKYVGIYKTSNKTKAYWDILIIIIALCFSFCSPVENLFYFCLNPLITFWMIVLCHNKIKKKNKMRYMNVDTKVNKAYKITTTRQKTKTKTKLSLFAICCLNYTVWFFLLKCAGFFHFLHNGYQL